MYPRSPQKELTSDSGSKALSWLRSSCLPLFQLLPLLFVDWKPSCELPGSSKATRRVEDNVFQRLPRPAPASSPEMLQIGEKPPTESQDRCGAAGGHPLGLFFLYGLGQILPVLWVLVSPSAVELIIPAYNFPPAQGHAWASVLVPTIRTRTFSEKDGDAWGSPYDLLFLALSLPLGSRCLLGPQRPGPASRPGRGL